MTAKLPHPHAELLAEAVLDISRKIEGKHIFSELWDQVDLSIVARSNQLWEFRFADTVENKTVSSLSDMELYSIVSKHSHDNEDVNLFVARLVANAAAERHAADSIAPELKNSHPDQSKNFTSHELLRRAHGKSQNFTRD